MFGDTRSMSRKLLDSSILTDASTQKSNSSTDESKIRNDIINSIPMCPDWDRYSIDLYTLDCSQNINVFSEISDSYVDSRSSEYSHRNKDDDIREVCSSISQSDDYKSISISDSSEENIIFSKTASLMSSSYRPEMSGDMLMFGSGYSLSDFGSLDCGSILGDPSFSPYTYLMTSNSSPFSSPVHSKSSVTEEVTTGISSVRSVVSSKRSSTSRSQARPSDAKLSKKDLEKRQSHNNMEKMRRRVVAQAFDMVVKAVGHESTRKPSKVNILSIAIKYCKNFDTSRETISKQQKNLINSRRELRNKIMSYL